MKVVEIRKLSTSELTAQCTKTRDEINDLRRQLQVGELHNVKQIRAKRRDLARMLTVLSEQLSKENI